MLQFCTLPEDRGPSPSARCPSGAYPKLAEGSLRTLGSSYLALTLQGPGAAPPGAEPTTILNLIAEATPVSAGVLAILALLSIFCWSIILYKLWVFRRSARQSVNFLDVFRRSSKFSEVQAVCRSLNDSPLVGLFQAGYAELNAQLRQNPGADMVETQASNPRAGASRPTLKSLPAVDRALVRASVVEVNKLESRLPFLATTASIAPFVGLFGTVVGIMMAFQGIGQTGSTNLGVVAPGIADALVATAAGLVAAIPAVIAYNHLSNRVRLFASEMDDFAMEFLNIAERNFT
jgi:biopolymer transport protein TolQ